MLLCEGGDSSCHIGLKNKDGLGRFGFNNDILGTHMQFTYQRLMSASMKVADHRRVFNHKPCMLLILK